MRVFRGGGLTKDAIYLRGLVDLLDHVRDGGSLDLLWRGKSSLRDLPMVSELDEEGVLRPARLRPRYLDDPASVTRLEAAAHNDALANLLG
jgi:hypothetical protein